MPALFSLYYFTRFQSHKDSFSQTRRSSSRTSISANPRRFCPFRFSGLCILGEPLGFVSTKMLYPVESKQSLKMRF